MPKNKGKGGKNRKKGKNDNMSQKRELIFKEEGQEYALVTKLLGNCNMNVDGADEVKRIAHVRGAMRKKVWMNVHDTVLLSLREYQDGKADIIHKYDADEVRMLISYGELPSRWAQDSYDVSDVVDNDQVDVAFDIDEI